MSQVKKKRVISVTGLGYVGLPVAVGFARAGYRVIGFDLADSRVSELRSGIDRTREVTAAALQEPHLFFTSAPADLTAADFHIITVPTPITAARQPDLGPLIAASRAVGAILKRGDIVVFESTVYPGATEEVCVPLLERESGFRLGVDFGVGYSPERINPGDPNHRLETIVKVVSGSDAMTTALVAETYGVVVHAGIHIAPSIKVAEAAKVIENTQRDLNIALMNELALIFDRLGVRTHDVLAAAGTKWNFLRFSPGLVGGHCIGVDPYYLTAKAQSVGYHPEVILAGRRTNDGMGAFVAQKLVKLLLAKGVSAQTARVGIFGITFKENVVDLRNSRVPEIISVLRDFSIEPFVHDPLVSADDAEHEYGLRIVDKDALRDLDGLILAVPHAAYLADGFSLGRAALHPGAVLIDVRSALDPVDWQDMAYWSL